jgi:CubicO group peptidase (beta-lactamase class C family)
MLRITLPRPALFIAALLAAAAPLVRADAGWPLPVTKPETANVSASRLDTLHKNLRDRVDAGRYSGYITLLARDGKIVDWRAYGWQDLAAKTPLQRDSIVRIYSMSKIITSVAALMLVEEGRIALGDPAEKFLPALKNLKVFNGGTADAPVLVDSNRPITVRDLLTHTSGYYYDESWSSDAIPMQLMKREKIWDVANLDEFVARVARVPLHEQPGTRFRYGISTDLIGAIVEKASGLPLDRFFQQRIFTPLGMRDTDFIVPPEKRDRLAIVYQRQPDGTLVPSDWANEDNVTEKGGLLSGGGGLFSTAGDYVRFAQMLLNRGELDGVRILSRKTVELMTQNHLSQLADPTPRIPSQGFGLGVRVVNDLSKSTLLGSEGAFGWDGAATTHVTIDPKERLVALILLQHVPFNQDDVFALFTNGFYSALTN